LIVLFSLHNLHNATCSIVAVIAFVKGRSQEIGSVMLYPISICLSRRLWDYFTGPEQRSLDRSSICGERGSM